MKNLRLLLCTAAIIIFAGTLKAQYTNTDLQNAIDAAAPGATITLNSGTYVFSAVVNVNKAGVTLLGNNTIFEVSGTGDRLDISSDGVTLENVEIIKTDKTGEQNIIRLRANNITIKNNIIHGQYVFEDGEVSRAMVFNAGGYTGLQIEGNTIYNLRQPAYISGTNLGNIINNHTYNTKGWVVEGGNLTFTNNTWGVNVFDIAIIPACPAIYYTDIVAMSNVNNGAVIEDQRVTPRVLSVVYVDASTSFSSDLGGKYHPYSTITPALTRVVSGGKIMVAAGAYEEQLTIDNKSISIVGSGNASTFINSPVTLAATFATSYTYKCIVGVVNNGNLNIRGLTINGLGRGNANNRFVGIGFRNSAGRVEDCKIVDIRDTPFSGVQHGVAIFSYNDDLLPRTIDVLNNEIVGFQKNAMALNAGSTNPLAVNVQGNIVTGYGATNVTAQNGIQVFGDFITGVVKNNSITGIGYSGSGWVATSILNFYAEVDIISNTVSDGHVGIYNIDGASDILTNNITAKKIGDYGYGIIASDPPQAVPSPFDFTEQSNKINGNSLTGIESVLSVNVSGNIVAFTGPDNTGTYGIEADAGYGPDDLIFLATNNTVSGFGVGFGIYKCESGCNTGVFISVDIHNNNIINNTLGLETNVLIPLIDAEFNWWGTTIESEIQAIIVGTVDYDPWIGKGTTIEWSSSIIVNDVNSDGLTNLFFGQNSTATDGIDLHLLEEELPPLPPSGVFDSRFILPVGNSASHRDYRSDTKRFVKWLIQFQGTPPFDFAWEPLSLPLGDFYLKDAIDGSYVNINMKNQSSYSLPLSLELNQLVIENSIYNCYPFNVTEEWNLISLPLSPSNPLKTSLFPTAISDAFGFSGAGYYVASVLESKKGYWLKFDADQSTVECGVSSDDIIPVNAGWNMIGVLDEDVPKTRITTVPSGIIAGSFFGYQGGYVIADLLKVGKGYWVKSSAAGVIELHNILRKEEEYISPIKADWASITISDDQSKKMILYLAENVDKDRFDLPPVPPEGAFDVRFASGSMVETLTDAGVVINISTTKYPVSIKVSGLDVFVRDLIDGSLLNESITTGSELIITDSRITKIRLYGNYITETPFTYSLEQNYPNPFNPSTSINFSIPKEGLVNLNVFNILGERVMELKNEVMKPGYYQVAFDASSLASGVYFYTINAGDFVESKKMMLLK